MENVIIITIKMFSSKLQLQVIEFSSITDYLNNGDHYNRLQLPYVTMLSEELPR